MKFFGLIIKTDRQYQQDLQQNAQQVYINTVIEDYDRDAELDIDLAIKELMKYKNGKYQMSNDRD